MDRDSNPGVSADESSHEDSGLEQIPQGNCAEPVKKIPGNNLIRCDICCCDMSSTAVLNSHMNGSRHKKKMKALEIVANLRAMGPKGVDVGSKISNNSYRCDLCCLTVNSPQQLQVHLSGSKHKNKIAKEKSLKFSTMTNMKSVPDYEAPVTDDLAPPVKKKKTDEPTFTCVVCNIVLNSESQYEQHIYSKRHLSKSKGKKGDKIPGASENEPDLLPSFTPGNQLHGSKECGGANLNGNAGSLIQVHSPDDSTNQNFIKGQSECGNDADFIQRHILTDQKTRGESGDVDLCGVEKFYNKIKSSICNSDESVVQASPRP